MGLTRHRSRFGVAMLHCRQFPGGRWQLGAGVLSPCWRASTMEKHIIVVEDDDGLRYGYCKLLGRNGYTAHPFPDYRGVITAVRWNFVPLGVGIGSHDHGTPHCVRIKPSLRP